nr:ribonuclease H-like domain-containing protein [Tanacetum cinerariifolium]
MCFSKRPGSDTVCYTKPLDLLKNWNDRFFWVDAFACPASFPWNTSKGVPKDPFPKSFEFNAEHFATFVALPAPFRKYPEAFICLVGISRYYIMDEDAYPGFLGDNDEEMDLLSFIRTADPTKVRVAERQRVENEPRLLESTVGRVVPLIPIALARASNELEASVDKLFDEGASGDGQGTDIQRVAVTTDTIMKDVAPLQPRRQRKRKIVVANASGPSHPPKKGEPITTLPFVTSSVSATPECEDKSPADSVTVLNRRTIGAPQRSSAPTIATVTTVTAAIDADATAARAHVAPFLFGVGSSSTVYVPRWSATNGFGLDDIRICREMLDEFALPNFFASVRGMDHDQLFTEFNVGAARQIYLNAEVRMCAEYNIREKRNLRAIIDEQAELLKVKDGEIESLKGKLLLKEAEAAKAIRLRAEVFKFEAAEQSLRGEVGVLRDQSAALEREKNELSVKVTDLSASVKVKEQEVADLDAQVTAVKLQNDNLVDQVHELEISSARLQEKVAAYEDFIGQLKKFQDKKLEEVNEKFNKLCADFVDMSLHLEEKFYQHLLSTIYGRRWLLTYGMELAVVKCLNSTEYLSALGAAISKAVEKGMQEGLSDGIPCGAEGRKFADVAAYNPSAEADYLSALQHLQNVNFSLIAELKSNKDASLMVPIHHSPDQRVVGASAFPFLGGMKCTSGSTHDTTTTLPVTFVSTSTISPISTDDYEVAHADGQGVADVPCSRKGVSIAVSKPVCSFAQCFRDFVWSLALRFKLASVFRMACFVVPVDKVSWTKVEVQTDAQDFIILTISTSAVLKVGMPISAGITASAPYVNENGVSPLLDLIMMRCAHKTPLAWGCLTEAKHWRMLNFSHRSLNGLSLNCFPLSDTISLERPNLHTILSHMNFLTRVPVMVATGLASIHLVASVEKPSPTEVEGLSSLPCKVECLLEAPSENGNSFIPVAQTTNADDTSTTLIPGHVTTEEKVQKKNDVKARSMLLMTLPNKHLMTFNQYKDAKTLFAAIQIRFGGNEATKKTQNTLLKQMYENFSASSTESLDSNFNRLQKIVSQLAILGENISKEDLHLKFFRSLPSEWNTHNMAFVSSPSSTSEVNTTYGVSTVNTQANPGSTQVNTASTTNLSDATVYAFLASQPNGSQLAHENLVQIYEDELEGMYLKWQLALLSMRTRRFFQKTGRKITINWNDTAKYDKSKETCPISHILRNSMEDMLPLGDEQIVAELLFWQTATASTLDNGEIEITATIDGVKVVTEASVRRHLKLEDSDGISNFPTTKFFEQLAFMGNMKRASKGYSRVDILLFLTMIVHGLIFQGEGSTVLVEFHHTPTCAPSTSESHISPTPKSSIRQETEIPQYSSPPHTNVADEAASTSVDVTHGWAATTVTNLDAGQGSGTIHKTPSMPHDSPLPRVHTLRSDVGIMQHNELMDLVIKLSDRVAAWRQN